MSIDFTAKLSVVYYNNSGKIELTDITAALQAYVNGNALDYRTFKAADINSNGTLDLTDVTSLLKKYVNG